jgi:hypothetical protein
LWLETTKKVLPVTNIILLLQRNQFVSNGLQ